MFPFELEDELLGIEEEASYEVPREHEINFKTGQLTGKIVEGVDALKTWAWLALQTPITRYMIYTWEYGSELESLIGKSFSGEYIETECRRMVEECLVVNKHITGIEDFSYRLDEDRLSLSFRMITEFGEAEMNV